MLSPCNPCHLSWYTIIVKSRYYKILHTDMAHDIHKLAKIAALYSQNTFYIIIKLFHCQRLLLQIFSVIVSNPQLVTEIPLRLDTDIKQHLKEKKLHDYNLCI